MIPSPILPFLFVLFLLTVQSHTLTTPQPSHNYNKEEEWTPSNPNQSPISIYDKGENKLHGPYSLSEAQFFKSTSWHHLQQENEIIPSDNHMYRFTLLCDKYRKEHGMDLSPSFQIILKGTLVDENNHPSGEVFVELAREGL